VRVRGGRGRGRGTARPGQSRRGREIWRLARELLRGGFWSAPEADVEMRVRTSDGWWLHAYASLFFEDFAPSLVVGIKFDRNARQRDTSGVRASRWFRRLRKQVTGRFDVDVDVRRSRVALVRRLQDFTPKVVLRDLDGIANALVPVGRTRLKLDPLSSDMRGVGPLIAILHSIASGLGPWAVARISLQRGNPGSLWAVLSPSADSATGRKGFSASLFPGGDQPRDRRIFTRIRRSMVRSRYRYHRETV
jgi:hypothetical protein